MRDVELEKIKEYAAEDADITLQLRNALLPQLKKKEVEKVFDEVENPLVKVLADMEFEGVRIDTDFLMSILNNWKRKRNRQKKTFTGRPASDSILLHPNNWEKCCLRN